MICKWNGVQGLKLSQATLSVSINQLWAIISCRRTHSIVLWCSSWSQFELQDHLRDSDRSAGDAASNHFQLTHNQPQSRMYPLHRSPNIFQWEHCWCGWMTQWHAGYSSQAMCSWQLLAEEGIIDLLNEHQVSRLTEKCEKKIFEKNMKSS